MAGQVTYTPTEEDVAASSRDWFGRYLRQPRMKGALYVAALAGALLAVAFALQAGGPPARALRAGALGGVGGLVLIVLIVAWRYAMLPGLARRSFRQNRAMHRPFTYAWSDEGISWESEMSSARIAWDALYRWGEGKSAFFFAFSERGVHFVPRRALDEAAAADLRATAERFGPARF